MVTRENAKKAVAEIKKVPPKLAIYSVAAAAAIILLVVLGISYHITIRAPMMTLRQRAPRSQPSNGSRRWCKRLRR